MGGFSQYGQQANESSRWRPALIALHRDCDHRRAGLVAEPPQFTCARPGRSARLCRQPANQRPALSTAQNFVGAKVTYLQGKIANLGDKSVSAIEVEAIFRNSLGEIVDRQTQPLRVAASPLGNPDSGRAAQAPLGPGKTAFPPDLRPHLRRLEYGLSRVALRTVVTQ